MKLYGPEVLRSPCCRGALREEPREGQEPELVCEACEARYPVRDGIPCLVHIDYTSLGMLTELLAHQSAYRNLLRMPAGTAWTEARKQEYDHYHVPAWRAFDQVRPDFDGAAAPRVLDVGAADGTTSARLAEAGGRVVSTDLALSLLREPGDVETLRPIAWLPEEAQAEARARLQCAPYYVDRVQASADRLPFADETFDYVFCRALLHHVPDVRAAIVEMARVLRVGGRLVACAEPFRALGDTEFERLKWTQDYLLGVNEHYPLLSEYRGAFGAAGLRPPKLLMMDVLPGLRWDRVPRLAQRILRRLLRPLPWRELPVGYGPLMRFCSGGVSLVAIKRRHRPGRRRSGPRLVDPGMLNGNQDFGPRLAQAVRELRRDGPFRSRVEAGVAPQEEMRVGWWPPEPIGSGARRARYSFPYCKVTLRVPRGGTTVEVTCRGFAAETGAPTRGTVWINGTEAGAYCLEGSEWQKVRFPVPAGEPIIDMEMEIDEVYIPDQHVHNGDMRTLGIAVASIAVVRDRG
jgi:SAM-dependent methyltransferase/uncharacterized protein YbaR (Trm112 family)